MQTKRPPIVSVLGHVDHGKTSLLDALRQSRVTVREAGGITQSIGASVVTDKNQNEITFIDTPGHAAFNKMRFRGAALSDIALLVVAADDGVKPQTLEALKFIREAETPFIVVLTKVDLPAARIDVALGQLEKEGVLFEGRGGDTPYLQVSAKEKKGLTELIEMIILLSEVLGVTGDASEKLDAYVVETHKDKGGPLVSVVVKNGTLRVGETIFFTGGETKVRGIFDWQLKPVKEVVPGYPGQVLGFSNVPAVGSLISGTKLEIQNIATQLVEKPDLKTDINIVLKAVSAGVLEAIKGSLPENVGIALSGVGDVSETDVLFAKDSNCDVFVFDTKVSNQVKKLAETEGVAIYEFKIIYELIDKIKTLIEEGRVKIIGEADILQAFPFNEKKVAGCKVKSGKIFKNRPLTVLRAGEEIGKVKIISLKKQKQDVEMVAQGEEFGVIFTPQLDFARGDVLLSVEN